VASRHPSEARGPKLPMKTQPSLFKALAEHDFLLMEAAVTEALSRRSDFFVHPELGPAVCVLDQTGRQALRTLYSSFAAVARSAEVPLIVTAPTWRANPERIQKGCCPVDINREAVAFMRGLRQELTDGWSVGILAGALLGPKNDAYRPDQSLAAHEALEFHTWQANELAEAKADFLMAATLPALEEAAGMARAMTRTGLPAIVSFVIDKTGRLLDGRSLYEAIDRIDGSCTPPPAGYMINCSYPSFFKPETEPPQVLDRLLGYQANASSLAHYELDGSVNIQADDPADWARRMAVLHRRWGLKILGGCCGTGEEHLSILVRSIRD